MGFESLPQNQNSGGMQGRPQAPTNIFLAQAEHDNPLYSTLTRDLSQIVQKIGAIRIAMQKGEYSGSLQDLSDLESARDELTVKIKKHPDYAPAEEKGFEDNFNGRDRRITAQNDKRLRLN